VIDSFHGKGKCQSDIENDYSFLINDYVVIIDEVEQFLWHLFDSSTEVKKHRCEVIKQFELLIKNANQIYILDADLTDVSIDYIRAICDNDDINIIKNEYKEGGYKAFIHQSPEAVISAMLSAIENDKKVLVCTDGQKLKSKYSTQNMEKLINKKYPHKKILIVDSHTISDPSNIAYGCVTQLNSMINQFDVVICSPSVGTGISIDIKGYVDVVYGIFQGVQGENAVRQQLMRLRDNCDRHLYISKTGMNFTGDGSTSLYMLSDCQHKQFKNHLQMLRHN
ncbi:MAG: plasmid replication protein, CyRepA1 family, partial [Dolichospermum sp.]